MKDQMIRFKYRLEDFIGSKSVCNIKTAALYVLNCIMIYLPIRMVVGGLATTLVFTLFPFTFHGLMFYLNVDMTDVSIFEVGVAMGFVSFFVSFPALEFKSED